MPSNFTANYNLSQWERTDKVQMEDFNDDNAKIDGALGEHAAALTAQAAQIAKCGNCRIYVATYTGTGTYGANAPSSHTFPGQPQLVFITGQNGSLFFFARGITQAYGVGMSPQYNTLTWSGNTLKWYNTQYGNLQANNAGEKYFIVALIDASK